MSPRPNGADAHADLAADLIELRRIVSDQSELIANQGALIDELRARTATQPQDEERSSRRGLLRLAGAAVVGSAAASLLGAKPAAAATGAMTYGTLMDAATDGTALTSSAVYTFNAISTHSLGDAIKGTAQSSGTGVHGVLANPALLGYGVWGSVSGTIGTALVGEGGSAQLLLKPFSSYGKPVADPHYRGEIVSNLSGLFLCVSSGTPGTWLKLAGPDSAGAFHAITPTRVYDSRAAAPSPGLLATGSNRLISVADGRDGNGAVTTADLVPAGATAVAANITVTGTTGAFGYLAINPGGNTVAGASTINWSAPGLTIANGVSLTLNASRELTVICDGGGSTHFLVDIAGYYL